MYGRDNKTKKIYKVLQENELDISTVMEFANVYPKLSLVRMVLESQ